MKKFLITLLVGLFLVVAPFAFAANESVTQGTKYYKNGYTVHTFTVLADDADGTVTATATDISIIGMIVMVEINPGATGPTNGAWDVNLESSDGVQILGSQADDLSSTVSIAVAPNPTSGNMDGNYFSNGALTLSIDDNSVNAAVFTVRIFYYSDK